MNNEKWFCLKNLVSDLSSWRAGRFTPLQVKRLVEAARAGKENPSYLSDLEGAGPIAELERAMARVLDVRHVLALSSCTAAIHTALLAMGIGPGDEVIVSPYSWGQSVAPVLFTGATAVFADIDPDTLCLDPASVQESLSPRTRAILPIHLFGHMSDMNALTKIADANGLAVAADAAHAMGARLAGRTVAQWGDTACFSLGRGKLVSGGEGGLLATDYADLYERALSLTQHPTRIMRELGPGSKGVGSEDLGYNYRMHPLAAVLALADIENLEQRLSHRRNVWAAFHEGLGEVPFLSPPVSQASEQWTAYGISLTFKDKKNGAVSREELVAAAQQQGVPLRCGPVETPLHLRSAFQRSNDVAYCAHCIQSHTSHRPGACPVAEQRCAHEELWALSALDMDGIGGEQAYELGRRLMMCCNVPGARSIKKAAWKRPLL